ncbi:tetratricopeptide repeat protein 39B-like [Bacillus rossius redtenbacheri]|uniref:tetratricopeptide repeat protein 39B-like n=1 Tax=Bacillus rossius redtenbacheri TaxID=93214 RepID=UPI002FDD477D
MDSADTEDDFQDACEIQPMPCSMDIDTAMEEARSAVHYFFNNKFEEAREILKPWAETSMYHAVGNSVFLFLEAMLTFEQGHIEAASDALKHCIAVCNKYRKKSTITESIGKMVKKTNYEQYTTEEIHAELCYAESLLLKSMLTFIEDETLVSFIKAGLKIRLCYNSYKECMNILNTRKWQHENHKIHFESGVRMGIGAFNLMISLLPGRVIKLLEFIGFSGSRHVGLKELELGYKLHNSIRQILCVMALLCYHLIVIHVFSHFEGDLDFCDEILKHQLQLYPDGVWFLFFKGRLEFMKGNIDESISWYTRSWKSQSVWPQFHHLCFWELTWTNSIKCDWREASVYAGFLLEESRWSKTIYSYQKAAILIMLGENMTAEEKSEIENLMRNAPQWKQRIAGKSLPMEKFAIKKTSRYFTQENSLVLPAIELMYVWNLFKVLGKKHHLVLQMYKIIEKALVRLNEQQERTDYDADNRALVLLLKAACLRQMRSPLQAEECLQTVLSLEKKLKEDLYLVPYAMVELAFVCKDMGDLNRASQLLEDAKKNYTGYSLESRLHFKIHAFQADLEETKQSSDEKVPESSKF